MDVNAAVLDRYSEGANARQAELCCPVDYDQELLALVPAEIKEKDYGCGDPSRYVRPGDTVLDLGSGSGKICYMAAQLVGPRGRVIGVDMNSDMLALARRYQAEMAEKLGEDRVTFLRGQIQDLALDLDALDAWLTEHPVTDAPGWLAFQRWCAEAREQHPLVADDCVDLVVSNCVLNLVGDAEKHQLLAEIFRVVKPGGRVAISDIVADRPVPAELKADPVLWSGCLSGAFEEQAFLEAFRAAGFSGVRYHKWTDEPWQVVGEIVFRSVTVTAHKPAAAEDGEDNLLYRGPFASVMDDAGNTFARGARTRVSRAEAAALLAAAPDAFVALDSQGEASGTSRNGGCCG